MRTDRITEEQWPDYLEEILATDEQADFSDELNRWHTFLEVEVIGAFTGQRSPEGDTWEPWLWRNREWHGEPKALVRSGRLHDSFVRGGSENIDEVEGKSSVYGSSVPYAGIHQTGGQSKVSEPPLHLRGKPWIDWVYDTIDVPPRPMIGMRDDMVEVLADAIADGIVERMKG